MLSFFKSVPQCGPLIQKFLNPPLTTEAAREEQLSTQQQSEMQMGKEVMLSRIEFSFSSLHYSNFTTCIIDL